MMSTIRTLTGKSLIAAVFGWPITHSRSPRLHGYWLQHYGIDGAYIPFSTHPAQFDQALRALPALGFRGANVTLPHKERALTAVDRLTDRARRVGAVNTIIVDEDGRMLGDNTDGFGFVEHLFATIPDWQPIAGPAAVLTAAGAAPALLVALLEGGVPEIPLVKRTNRRAGDIDGAVGSHSFNR